MYSNKSMGMENKGREEMSEITDREKFEEWCGDTSWTPYQKSIMFLAWQEQQKKINELEQQRDEAVELLQFLYDNIENIYTVESAIINYIQKAGKHE